MFILRQGMFRLQNLPKSVMFDESFPGRQLNAASRKSLEIKASCIAKKKNPFEPKIFLYKGFKVL